MRRSLPSFEMLNPRNFHCSGRAETASAPAHCLCVPGKMRPMVTNAPRAIGWLRCARVACARPRRGVARQPDIRSMSSSEFGHRRCGDKHRDRRAQAPALANFTGLLRLRVPRRKLPHRRRFRPPARRRLGYLARPFGLACDKSIDLVDPQAPQVHAGAQENAEFTPALILDAASPNRPYPAKRANKWRSAGARPTQAARIRFSIDGA
jgi:hypothetical protein